MGEEKRREQRVPAELKIRLGYGSIDEFIERYALNISRGGIFVRTLDPKPVGTDVTLDIAIESGDRVVHGKGVVAWTAAPSAPGEEAHEPGMGIKFTELDGESRALVDLVEKVDPGHVAALGRRAARTLKKSFIVKNKPMMKRMSAAVHAAKMRRLDALSIGVDTPVSELPLLATPSPMMNGLDMEWALYESVCAATRFPTDARRPLCVAICKQYLVATGEAEDATEE